MLSGSCGAESAVESNVEWVEGLLPLLGPSCSATMGGVQGHHGEIDAFEPVLLLRGVPPTSHGLQIFALTDSIAVVVQTIRRISQSKPGKGVNSAHAFSRAG